MTAFKESLRRRFLFSFAGLLAGLALLSLSLTLGSLYLYYRSTVDERTREVSRRFEVAFREAQEALLFRTRILANVARIEAMGLDARTVREIQVYTLRWLKSDGLKVLGMGGREYWRTHGYTGQMLARAFLGVPLVELHVIEDAPPMLLAAVPKEGLEGVSEVIVASLPLDADALARLAARLGGEIALYDGNGRMLASSLLQASVPSRTRVLSTASGPVTTAILDGVPFAARSFELAVGQKTDGVYTVFWPVAELRALTVRLAVLLLAGTALGLVLFYLLYRRIIARTASDIESLTGWAQGFTPDHPIPPPALARADEVGVLSEVFAGLVGDLKIAFEEVEVKNLALAEVNVTLEEKVTEKTREVEDQRRLLDSVLSGMSQAVFLLENDQTVAYANETARDLFGDVEGRPCADVWGVSSPCDSRASAEIELTRDHRTYLVTTTPLGDDRRAVLVAQDVTERRGLERQLQQAQKLESVGRLAGGVAHDFNNVLASIVPCVDILRRRLVEPKDIACLDTIDSATDRASNVVRQLLAFGRSGEFQPVPLDLNAAVEGALDLMRPGLENVRLEWLPGPRFPLVRADETQIQQVILNLVLNAVDAMGGEGTVTVETGRLHDGETALVAVEDTGPGILPHIQDKIFDPFFTTKESGKGTGLGLSIVYGVVERHGGKIHVSSPAGLGARFEIELPALRAAPRGAPSVGPATATLLVVDDDALLLRILTASLHELGFRVLAARGGVEALNTLAAESNPVDAAVVDVRMPSMSGLELAQKLRESSPDLPIVFMTGFSDERNEDLSRLSAVKPLLKPFSPSQLADTLRALLGADP